MIITCCITSTVGSVVAWSFANLVGGICGAIFQGCCDIIGGSIVGVILGLI